MAGVGRALRAGNSGLGIRATDGNADPAFLGGILAALFGILFCVVVFAYMKRYHPHHWCVVCCACYGRHEEERVVAAFRPRTGAYAALIRLWTLITSSRPYFLRQRAATGPAPTAAEGPHPHGHHHAHGPGHGHGQGHGPHGEGHGEHHDHKHTGAVRAGSARHLSPGQMDRHPTGDDKAGLGSVQSVGGGSFYSASSSRDTVSRPGRRGNDANVVQRAPSVGAGLRGFSDSRRVIMRRHSSTGSEVPDCRDGRGLESTRPGIRPGAAAAAAGRATTQDQAVSMGQVGTGTATARLLGQFNASQRNASLQTAASRAQMAANASHSRLAGQDPRPNLHNLRSNSNTLRLPGAVEVEEEDDGPTSEDFSPMAVKGRAANGRAANGRAANGRAANGRSARRHTLSSPTASSIYKGFKDGGHDAPIAVTSLAGRPGANMRPAPSPGR